MRTARPRAAGRQDGARKAEGRIASNGPSELIESYSQQAFDRDCGPRQRGVPTAHACAVGCERGVPTAHACAVGCERRGPAGSPSGHSTSDIMIRMNRLAQERSPYLLQHANNPVEWFPWSDEAFAKARVEDKPIFLSVGYSTCHWCHVMEHESFENDDVAAVLNANFVSIKVDREERPDVDRFYMTFVQATTGGGGWPMSVWLTPDLKPFVGGTYFPPEDRYGQPAFKKVLERIAAAWKQDHEKIAEQGSKIVEALRESQKAPAETAAKIDNQVFNSAYEQLAR